MYAPALCALSPGAVLKGGTVLPQERVRDWRPTWRLNNTDPIASNFYPLTAAIEIAQPGHSALSVLTDRAQGEM
jgi:Glycosyl hydrolases family 38 C-terminal domain